MLEPNFDPEPAAVRIYRCRYVSPCKERPASLRSSTCAPASSRFRPSRSWPSSASNDQRSAQSLRARSASATNADSFFSTGSGDSLGNVDGRLAL
jgi:hypothetical protein